MVDEILYSSGDGEDMRRGLSSFGAEMIRLNEIIKIAKVIPKYWLSLMSLPTPPTLRRVCPCEWIG